MKVQFPSDCLFGSRFNNECGVGLVHTSWDFPVLQRIFCYMYVERETTCIQFIETVDLNQTLQYCVSHLGLMRYEYAS